MLCGVIRRSSCAMMRVAAAPHSATVRCMSPLHTAAAPFAVTTTLPKSHELILGCGSNVVDKFYRVKTMPKAGEKGYFASVDKIESASIVGGVTLNHLSWAAALGARVGLLASQGTDQVGEEIRAAMGDMNVSTEFLHVNDRLASSVSMIFLQTDGERCIVMAPAATSTINGESAKKNFVGAITERAKMVSSEVSQVPLSGVNALFAAAKAKGALTLLDVDVPPSVAIGQAALGTIDELKAVLHAADVVKPTLESAVELFELLSPGTPAPKQGEPLEDVAARLLSVLPHAKMVALTDGKRGAALAVDGIKVLVPVFPVGEVVDTTGAGDAFFGGLLAGVWHNGGLPKNITALKSVGQIASAAGAACVQVLGALPTPGKSAQDILKLLPPDLRNKIGKLSTSTTQPATSSVSTANSPSTATVTNLQSTLNESLRLDAAAATNLARKVDVAAVERVVSALVNGRASHVYVTAVGKSGAVASRLASSLSSLGLPATFVHAGEWIHGDLGRLRSADVVLLLSHSGRTPELLTLLPHLQRKCITLAGIIGTPQDAAAAGSQDIAQACGQLLIRASIPPRSEPFDLVPTASVVVQEMIANAIVRGIVAKTAFTPESFKLNHPGGAIGQVKT